MADEARRSGVTRQKQTERKTGTDPAALCLEFICFQRDTFHFNTSSTFNYFYLIEEVESALPESFFFLHNYLYLYLSLFVLGTETE